MLFFNRIRIEEYFTVTLLRAHLCTLAVALSFNSVVRVPRDAIFYGGIPYLMVFTGLSILVALPSALIQLIVGQFQQNIISQWRAVPIFKGVGYLKLLTSFLASIYVVIYISMCFTYIIYGSSGALPFYECINLIMTSINYTNNITASNCLNSTFMAPVLDKPHYYAVVSVAVLIIWISVSCLMYNHIRHTKRLFYAIGPIIFILYLVIIISVADISGSLQTTCHWMDIFRPRIWYSALIQALLSSQVSTGYLLTAGNSVYYETNAKWTSVIFVTTNVISSWFFVLFWYAVGENYGEDVTTFSILVMIYDSIQKSDLHLTWPLLCLTVICLSGVITVITLLYPIYDVLKRLRGKQKWTTAIGVCTIGATLTMLVLAGRVVVINALDQMIVPSLTIFTITMEVSAFAYIYGAKKLVSDLEFLTGNENSTYWRIGLYIIPVLVTGVSIWWLIEVIVTEDFIIWTVIASFSVALIIFLVFASISVSQQIQYDWISKIMSSFKPSDWGPMDPISRYYWLVRRDEIQTGGVTTDESRPTTYSRYFLGQISGTPSFVQLNIAANSKPMEWPTLNLSFNRRANSDDIVYTGYRKKIIEALKIGDVKSSASLDKNFVMTDPN